MSSQRARRLLVVAFAISLLIHLVIASGVQWPFSLSKEETQTVVSIQHVRTLRVATIPTPSPHTPPPVTPSPHPSAPSKAPPNPQPAKPVSGTGIGKQKPPGGAPPTAPPTPLPTPIASPTPNCAKTDTDALLAATPPPPEIAPEARSDAANGVTAVRVSLDPSGTIVQTTVVQSSGNSSLDLVAVSMARAARYTPATHACKPIASEYVFKAKFSAW